MITTKTSDLLAQMAMRANAISSAVYEAGFRDEATALDAIAARLSQVSASIERKIEAGARAMLAEPLADAIPTSAEEPPHVA